MGNDIDALGAFATAGLAAHALDPVRPRHGGHGTSCANCDTVLTGEFCHACGQSAHVHRSIGHVFEEFLHGVWHFDSKAWRTLPLLVFRPGRLTRDYIYGRRARFIAPLALFLLSVFLMFFVFGLVGGPDVGGDDTTPDLITAARTDVIREQADVTKAEAKLIAARAAPGGDIAEAEVELVEERGELNDAKAEAARVAKLPAAEQRKIVAPDSWKAELADAARSGELEIDTGFPKIDANIRKALENPDFALYRVQQTAYKLSFLLVPLSLPLLWLMFCWRRDVTIYDHTVFALYSLSFMSLLFIVIALTGKLADMTGVPEIFATIAGLLTLTPPVHMYMQLKGSYGLSGGGALVRTFVLLAGTGIVLALFMAMIVVLGLAD